MLGYIVRRIIWSIPFFFAASVLAYIIIQAPPGDYVTSLAARMVSEGNDMDPSRIEALRIRFGLDDPHPVQYFRWITGAIQGDFGQSYEWDRPVSELIGQRMALSVILAFSTMLFTWAVALPFGIFSAVRKYTMGDYIITFIGFIGLATPNFLIALVLMYIGVVHFGSDVTGLFSSEYVNADWSFAKMLDLLKHMIIPVVIIGTSSTASLIRIMRANLLDELQKPYVVTARAKGLSETKLLLKYPVRLALNPFVSTLGWAFPQIISGSTIVAVVLSLPTADPLMLDALLTQDMYLAGAFILLLSALSIVGMLVSDILLALVDPRIRYR
ncbi:ABC transporter permease [uncultured Litoreibacter sp.]|uniref:ABC transporter permease n=1 Tax=uncultured Litoreibacter sp. TaxID=1392394 RepID=UPI0026260E2C|nr:ABC transporter permease [uncultured Litoreibacter sp.]